MKIWVDADATPRDVKRIVSRAALRLELPATLVANKRLHTAANNRFVEAVEVPGGPDAADDYIVAHARSGDLVVTADIPLAARLVAARIAALSPRGVVYTEETIGARLSVRDFMEGLRSAGVETGGPDAFGPRDKREFAASFDRILTGLLRAAPSDTRSSTGSVEP